jgi:DUF2934 family protein
MATKSQGPRSASADPSHLALSDEELFERVTRKAYELYQQRGEEPGHDIEDWITAESLVYEELRLAPSANEPIPGEIDDNENAEGSLK